MTVVVDEVQVVPRETQPAEPVAPPPAPDQREAVRRTLRELTVRRGRADRLQAC